MQKHHLSWLTTCSLLFTLLITYSGLSTADKNSGSPNIIIFVADDASIRDFGVYGNKSINTPNIDALSASGIQMTDAVLTTPQCSPSRISVLSGRYPHSTGAEDLHMPMPADVPILPELLNGAGYFTGHMLKRHYGPEAEKQFAWYDAGLDNFPTFLDHAADKPFFLWVGFEDPHRPYQEGIIENPHSPDSVFVPPYMVDAEGTRKDLAQYYDEVSRMDSVIGNFVSELEKRDLRDNTLIVFFSDNGAPFPREKGTLYDAGIMSPLIFSWPSNIESKQVYSEMVSLVDLAPTLLEITKLQKPVGMQGNSIAKTLFDLTQPGRQYAFSERNWHDCDEHLRSVRTPNFKLIKNAYLDKPLCTAADISHSPSYSDLQAGKRDQRLTTAQSLLFLHPRKQYELYDIKNDPFELNDLSDNPDYADTLEELSNVLERWIEKTNDFPPTERLRADLTDRYTGKWLTKDIPHAK